MLNIYFAVCIVDFYNIEMISRKINPGLNPGSFFISLCLPLSNPLTDPTRPDTMAMSFFRLPLRGLFYSVNFSSTSWEIDFPVSDRITSMR